MAYVIAETGINHGGSAETLRELVFAAKAAGADAVKFQFWDADTINRPAHVREYLNGIRLSVNDVMNAKFVADTIGIAPIVSIYDPRHVEYFPDSQGWAYLKIGHGEQDEDWPEAIDSGRVLRSFTEPRETRHIPMIVGKGYPTSVEEARALLAIMSPRVDTWGYSDHTGWVEMGGEAVDAGASYIEAHLSLGRDANNPDDAVSLTPSEFAEYVAIARKDGAGVEPWKH